MDDRPDPMRDSATYLMFELMRLARRTSVRMFPGRLRLPHMLVLACVARLGPMSQREVAAELRMDPGDLVGIVDALEEAGHVSRRRDPEDRRRYALDATEDGRLALGEALADREQLNEVLFEPLSPDEVRLFKDLILRVLAHHDTRFGAPGPCPPGHDTRAETGGRGSHAGR
ncbi:MarR family winged helix-turn-helix transcriptional regulator [Actinomadura syzygii]|uniref:Winged helix-turn-helix transcriptional regulator n=1 Tax=Actinomadura syzygii TaxID=1427538 RepID=A0A5D0UFW3_9ACTN|nr:MarR family winged helix-turn-helix transcriptional regulator [Actinomadura syzygii]TYC16542.1 winged helix-turn-helix transcriptional regulator [Actinomadura syzygii]